jgi:hypothetical protein
MRCAVLLGLVLLGLVLLSACGDGDPRPAEDPAERALAALRAAWSGGRGMETAALVERIQDAGAALWPATGPEDARALAAQKAHRELAVIAADVARDLAKDPAERAGWAARDPESLAIHDGHAAALAQGAAGYRAWVEGEGSAMLRRRIERLLAPR